MRLLIVVNTNEPLSDDDVKALADDAVAGGQVMQITDQSTGKDLFARFYDTDIAGETGDTAPGETGRDELSVEGEPQRPPSGAAE